MTNKAQMELARMIGEQMAPVLRESCDQLVKLMRSGAMGGLTRPGLTIDDVYKRTSWGPERIHSKRLLAELAEEFDGGVVLG